MPAESDPLPATRCRPPEATLEIAKSLAPRTGITEVTDITPLDCIGLPVFVSHRPESRAEHCTYGKGLRPLDAEVGAYVEAIEFFYDEPGNNEVITRWGTPRDVIGAKQHPDAILDFSPILQRKVDLDAPLLLAQARDIETGNEAWIPAELAFHPAPKVGQSLFGSCTTGLATGNSIVEATVHALAELIERDIWSFDFIRRNSKWVDPATLPEEVHAIVERAEHNGLRLIIRTILNDYGLPFFAAFLFDPAKPTRKFFNGGWGSHLNRTHALMSAVTEVAQSRLAFIHGGRKEPATQPNELELLQRDIAQVSDARQSIAFSDLPDSTIPCSLDDQLAALTACLRRVTQQPILRLVYTPPDSPLHVIRLVVPTLEDFRETTLRIGPRLKAALDAGATR